MNRAQRPGWGSVDHEKELAAAISAIDARRMPGVFTWNRRALALLWYCNMIQLGRNVRAVDLSELAGKDAAGEDSASAFAINHLGHVQAWSRS